MKIVYLTYDLDPQTGWGKYSSDIIREVGKAGHTIQILKEKDDGLVGEVVLQRGWGVFRAAWNVRKYLKDCDVVHALDGYPFGVIAALANVGLRKKLIITLIGTYSVAPLYNLKTKFLLTWAYHRAHTITAISNFTKREVLRKVNVAREILVVTPGIQAVNFEKREREDVIIGVGALKSRKGYHVSLPAFAEVVKKLPHLKYKIVGDQSDTNYVAALKQIVKTLGVEEKVEFLGKVSDTELARLYAISSLFALTSISKNHHLEGFGIVYLEANAHGLPVIGCLNSGAEEAVRDGVTGFLVPQKNVEKTAQAMLRILENQPLREQMAKDGLSWAKEHEWATLSSQYLALYK